MQTTVVNIKTHKYDVYIGRADNNRDGYFGNPFSISENGGREKSIELYREYFYKRLRIDPVFAIQIELLRGKKLGCFCKPEKCHGDIIVDYLDNHMKVLVCGDRNWRSRKVILDRLSKLPDNSIIIEGGCEGADLIAREIALDIGLEVVEFPAAWKKYGKAAGPIRNIKMLNAKPQLVIAFHNDIKRSKGTASTVREAKKRKINVEIISEF